MFGVESRFFLSINKLLVILLVFFLLISFIFCGFLQISNNFSVDGCNMTLLSLAHNYFKNNIISAFSGLFFIILIIFIKNESIKIKELNTGIYFFYLRVFDIVFKINNKIFQAFRRGIMHNQVYDTQINFAILK